MPALDGLRGIAVLMVLMHHFFGSPTGALGVDLFFVLSGYLITSILRAERQEPRYWRIFYTRRITRILPPYVILIIATIMFFDLRWRIFWPYFVFFGENFAVYKYYNLLIPLSICWSLAIEEHFYFVWPFLVRYFSDLTLAWTLATVIVLEPLLRVLAMSVFHRGPGALYVLTPYHIDGIAWGGLASIGISYRHSREMIEKFLKPSLIAASILFFVAFFVLHKARYSDPLFYASLGYPLADLTFFLFLAWLVLHQYSILARVVSWRPLRFFGLISYGLYLYHLEIELLFRRLGDHYGYKHYERLSLISFPASVLIAWLSYRFIEQRLLEIGRQKAGTYRTLAAPVITSR